MKIRYAMSALAGLLLVSAAWGQAGSAARPAAEPPVSKVGVLNIQVAITSTAEGKQASAELQSQFAPRQSELENLNKQISDLEGRLRAGANTLSDDEKARLQREGQQLSRSLQRKQQEFQDDTNEAQREVVDRIGNKMLQVLDRFAKENGFSLILDNSQSSVVLNFAPQTDVTQEIIRLYDQTYPVKGAIPAAQPRPAQPRPAQPRPAPAPTKPPQQ